VKRQKEKPETSDIGVYVVFSFGKSFSLQLQFPLFCVQHDYENAQTTERSFYLTFCVLSVS
jgi:hypothetical protein